MTSTPVKLYIMADTNKNMTKIMGDFGSAGIPGGYWMTNIYRRDFGAYGVYKHVDGDGYNMFSETEFLHLTRSAKCIELVQRPPLPDNEMRHLISVTTGLPADQRRYVLRALLNSVCFDDNGVPLSPKDRVLAVLSELSVSNHEGIANCSIGSFKIVIDLA